MGQGTEAERDNAPREDRSAAREAALTAAILRIGPSFDLDTVLHDMVESTRAPTGAPSGVIATVDDAGQPRDFVTSGRTEEQHRTMEAWPDRLRLFGHLGSLATPLCPPDLDARTRSLDCAPFPVPCGAFQAAPMRHRGASAGRFLLSGKEDGLASARA